MADDKWPMTDARKPAGKRRVRSFRSVISHFLANSFPDRLSDLSTITVNETIRRDQIHRTPAVKANAIAPSWN